MAHSVVSTRPGCRHPHDSEQRQCEG